MAFAEGETLRYFVSDGGDGVTQIAQLLNPGLDVREVVQLGNVLGHALRLNGTVAAPVERPTLPPGQAVPPKPRGEGSIGDEVLTALRQRPDCRAAELSEFMFGDRRERAVIQSALQRLEGRGLAYRSTDGWRARDSGGDVAPPRARRTRAPQRGTQYPAKVVLEWLREQPEGATHAEARAHFGVVDRKLMSNRLTQLRSTGRARFDGERYFAVDGAPG